MAVTRDFIDTYRKTPTAIEPVAVDFRDRVPATETIQSIEVTAEDENGADVTGTIIATTGRNGTRVIALLRNGTANKDYFIHYALIGLTMRLEAAIKLEVRP